MSRAEMLTSSCRELVDALGVPRSSVNMVLARSPGLLSSELLERLFARSPARPFFSPSYWPQTKAVCVRLFESAPINLQAVRCLSTSRKRVLQKPAAIVSEVQNEIARVITGFMFDSFFEHDYAPETRDLLAVSLVYHPLTRNSEMICSALLDSLGKLVSGEASVDQLCKIPGGGGYQVFMTRFLSN